MEAARAGLGEEGTLLIDAGTVWNEDVDAVRQHVVHGNRSGSSSFLQVAHDFLAYASPVEEEVVVGGGRVEPTGGVP